MTTSTTSSDSAPHSTDSPNRPLTPRSDTGPSRTRKNGGSTPNLDPDGGSFHSNGRTERNKSFGGIRRNQQRESPSLSRPIPLPPTLPNVNITTPTDTVVNTGDTVVNTGRKLPSPPSHIPTNSSNEVNISGEGWKHAGRQDRPVSFEMAIKGESNSSGSTTGPETDRSMPYYEVPSSSVPYVHGKNSTTHRVPAFEFSPPVASNNPDTTSPISHVTFRTTPPTPASLNAPSGFSDHRPYSLVHRPAPNNTRILPQNHSRLI